MFPIDLSNQCKQIKTTGAQYALQMVGKLWKKEGNLCWIVHVTFTEKYYTTSIQLLINSKAFFSSISMHFKFSIYWLCNRSKTFLDALWFKRCSFHRISKDHFKMLYSSNFVFQKYEKLSKIFCYLLKLLQILIFRRF